MLLILTLFKDLKIRIISKKDLTRLSVENRQLKFCVGKGKGIRMGRTIVALHMKSSGFTVFTEV